MCVLNDYVQCPLTYVQHMYRYRELVLICTVACILSHAHTPSHLHPHMHTSSHLHPHMHTHPHTYTLTCTHTLITCSLSVTMAGRMSPLPWLAIWRRSLWHLGRPSSGPRPLPCAAWLSAALWSSMMSSSTPPLRWSCPWSMWCHGRKEIRCGVCLGGGGRKLNSNGLCSYMVSFSLPSPPPLQPPSSLFSSFPSLCHCRYTPPPSL